MIDKFIPAIEDVRAALDANEDLDRALAEIAGEHGLALQALRNRAERSLGDLATYRERNAPRAAAVAELARQEREWAEARRQVIARAAERGTTMTRDQADSYIRFVGAEHALKHATSTPTPTWDDE